jgi:hypothetical protein
MMADHSSFLAPQVVGQGLGVRVGQPEHYQGGDGQPQHLPMGRVAGRAAVLGVDLIVIVVLLGAVLARRRWVSHQPGAFKGAIRVVEGEVLGLAGPPGPRQPWW